MADKSIVILISGRGSNMEALLDARLPARVAAVISNNPDARGLAIHAGIAAAVAVFLTLVWAVTSRGYFWPGWALLGLAIPLGAHAVVVRARRQGRSVSGGVQTG